MASQPKPYLKFEEYIALERKLGAKLEYYQGQVYGMSGASPAHVFIQANLGRHLGNSLDGTPCNALGSDLRVHIEASGLYTYPDVVIICGSLILDKNQAAMNPKILFEILSPTRQRYDLLGKFEPYRQIPSPDEWSCLRTHHLALSAVSAAATRPRSQCCCDSTPSLSSFSVLTCETSRRKARGRERSHAIGEMSALRRRHATRAKPDSFPAL